MSRRVVVTVIGIWVVCIAVAAELVALRGASQPSSRASRTLTLDVDAAGLQSIDLRATDGAVDILGTDEDRVSISTEVSASDPSHADLLGARRGDAFTARVAMPGDGAVEERWTVRVPRRLRVNLAAHDGAFTVEGVHGGVKVSAAAGLGSAPGLIRVKAPAGPVELSLSVGDIYAETSTNARGPIDVKADVGDAKVSLAGRNIVSPHAPGPGHRLRLKDEGPDAITLRVGVGTATLDIK